MSDCNTKPDPISVIQFLQICGKLKTEKRTGWVNHKVNLPESISDHMYRMAIISFLIQDKTINKERCMKIALVHDLAESIVGDITPTQGVSKEEKHKLEKEAMEKICRTINHPSISSEIFSLWNEYESQATPEAKLVKDFDKFEMILQAHEYEKGQNLELDTFYQTTKDQFKHPEVIDWVKELYKLRGKDIQ